MPAPPNHASEIRLRVTPPSHCAVRLARADAASDSEATRKPLGSDSEATRRGRRRVGGDPEPTRKRLGSDPEATRKRPGNDSDATRKRLECDAEATRKRLGRGAAQERPLEGLDGPGWWGGGGREKRGAIQAPSELRKAEPARPGPGPRPLAPRPWAAAVECGGRGGRRGTAAGDNTGEP